MDLKGSLVDTHLKIYPSEKLVTFLAKLTTKDSVPENILQFVDGKEKLKKQKHEAKPLSLHLKDKDLETLSKVKKAVAKPEENRNEEESGNSEIESNQTESDTKEDKQIQDETENEKEDDKEEVHNRSPFLTTTDLQWLYTHLQKQRENKNNIPYLHELLEGASVDVPDNKILKRNPILEARCVKLRAQQEAREYRKMTKGVDNVRMRFPEDSISYQMKQLNRQLIAIGQFIISIFAGFLFGFKGVEWMVGPLDFGFKLLLGVMCALVIALAEIYFLAKKLHEELSIPETVQLGGPPKFVDESMNDYTKSRRSIDKEHED